ncbi:hypothetical protein SAMN05660420_01005 [Desulfuromusa kysingii]|uniref:DUF4124 domain-containing protein n=2 Tax=Desulfuromusa kysingii TaxID=37625 RepID=A0A1H3XLZ5_9BACT|nr:hypothetical protein SAMN05660420_01005 [Desulfuromusa kysingii]
MVKFLSLLLVMMFISVTAQATTYSCRDKQGRLYMSDNLQALPEECRGKVKVVETEDPDNLNYVPAQKVSPGVSAEFEQEVHDVEMAQQQQKERVENLLQRAEQLAKQYNYAVEEKSRANRRWSYRSRGIIAEANQLIEKVRADKQQLLAEMSDEKMSWQEEEKMNSWLDEIAD